MILSEYFIKEYIFLDFKADNKNDVLLQMSNFTAQLKNIFPKLVYEAVLEREKMGSTAVGNAVAIPHARIDMVDKIFFSLGRSKDFVNFDSYDGKLCKIFILILIPLNDSINHLKILAKLARFFQNNDHIANLLNAKTPEEVFNTIALLNKE